MLEAIIAIALIAGVVLFIYVKNVDSPQRTTEIYKFQQELLEQIASDDSLRQEILQDRYENVNIFIISRMIAGFDYTIRICSINDICGYTGEYIPEIYSSERVISSTLQKYEPKKIKIFMWSK